ncbi:MAG: hypothetical protein HFH08_04315 [Bacilli bacterium]|nr:hypothetical protein [Bacilli bacterium]
MVKYIDKSHTYIESSVMIEEGTIIYPNVMLEGKTKIGKNCTIHMGCYLKNVEVGDNTIIYHSHIEESKIGNFCSIGPYTHIRPHCRIGDNIKIGSFVELKNSKIDMKTKIPHLSYIGDAIIGKNVTIGCGAITANYDGQEKHQTEIKDGAFIGCNSNLVAPVKVEKNAFIGAGSTITSDVPNDTLAIARVKTVMKKYKEEC